MQQDTVQIRVQGDIHNAVALHHYSITEDGELEETFVITLNDYGRLGELLQQVKQLGLTLVSVNRLEEVY